MKRKQLAHVLRSASRIAEDQEILVFGSQAILGSYSEDDLPEKAHASIEVDVTFFEDYQNTKSDLVDMHLGEDSQFHSTFDYYAQGVSIDVASLPVGWQNRLVPFSSEETEGATGHCLDAHDLVVSKLVAGRMKDLEFADALLRESLVDAELLVARAQLLAVPSEAKRVAGWVTGWIVKHRPT